MLKKLINPPLTNNQDLFEDARFQLTYRISLMLLITLVGLSITFLSMRRGIVFPTLAGVFVCIAFLVHLYKTKKYRPSAYTFGYLGAALCIYTLFGFPFEFHFIDTMWVMVISLFAFFTLPRFHSTLIFIAQVGSLTIHILFFANENIANVGVMPENVLIAMAINFMLCSFMIGYIIHQYIKVFIKAQTSSRISNDELQSQNQLIASQNEEKTVMLKEIHHRVKNNLQVITSLLRLQSKEVKDPQSLESFKDSINRVVAMALIHEKMYQTKNFNKIDLSSYLNNLIDDLTKSYALSNEVKTNITSTVSALSQERIVPFALIVNELVSNSLKHAFKNSQQGLIEINLKDHDDYIEMVYEDNGHWKNPTTDSSFGTDLIEVLTEQLDGQFDLETTPHTRYTFRLKK